VREATGVFLLSPASGERAPAAPAAHTPPFLAATDGPSLPSLSPSFVSRNNTQDDVLDAIMDTLPARDLAACELAWMRCRRLVLSGGLWRRAIARLHAGTAGLPTTDEWVGRDPAASSALWRALAWELDAPPDDLSLLAHALGASSTDQPEEAVGNTLSPRARPDGRRAFERERHGVVVDDEEDVGGPHSTYWSSAGSDAPGEGADGGGA
jgi:hypothetical protein